MALSRKCKDEILYIYVPAKEYEIYYPNTNEVPDVEITNEVWIKELVVLKCIGSIKVLGDKGEDGFKFKYGSHTAELYEWKYIVLNDHTHVLV